MIRHIGLFGGTFDPPHVGHIRLAEAVRDKYGIDLLLFIPVNIPPHKAEGCASAAQRFEMAELCARTVEKAVVCDIELKRGGTSYTVDTLRQLMYYFRDARFTLICGGDMFLSIHEWRRAGEIMRMCSVAAVPRTERERELFPAQAQMLRDKFGAAVLTPDFTVTEISSTEVRRNPEKAARDGLISAEIADYIKKNGIYTG